MSDRFFDQPVEPVEPSPELKASIMAKLSSTPQEKAPGTAEDIADVAQEPKVDVAPARPVASGPAARKARKRWSPRLVALTSIAASIVGILLFAGIVGSLIGSPLQPAPLSEAEIFENLNGAADVQRIETQLDSGETVTLVYSAAMGRAAVTWDDLPELPGDDVYELWLIRDAAESAGIFDDDVDSDFQVLDGTYTAGASIGLTAEPEGGSQVPTMDRLVAVWETTA